ncbi:MAG TPA: DUF2845 domain-containing protein [Xanthomonadaceae bacterium]|nr:DUF2845 domain-containing protein [Xanthomonadaceae bacterium]
MRTLTLAVAFWVAALFAADDACAALRCGSRLVNEGDFDFRLRETCGEPFYVDRWVDLVSHSVGPQTAVSQYVERADWYYDFGSNRLLQRVRVRDGRVVAFETLSSYGRNAPQRSCRGAALHSGLSVGELVSLCGPPAIRQDLGQAVRIGASPAESVLPMRRERWVYRIDKDRVTVVEIARGVVQDIDVEFQR